MTTYTENETCGNPGRLLSKGLGCLSTSKNASSKCRRQILSASALVLADIGILAGVRAVVAQYLANDGEHFVDYIGLLSGPKSLTSCVLLCICFAVQGQYTKRNSFYAECTQICLGVLLALLIEALLCISGDLDILIVPWVTTLIVLPFMRVATKRTLLRLGAWTVPTAVIGSASQCAAIAALTSRDWYRGFRVSVSVPKELLEGPSVQAGLRRVLRDSNVRHVITGLDGNCTAAAVARVASRQEGLSFGVALTSPALPIGEVFVDRFFGTDVVMLRQTEPLSPRMRVWVKRALDVVVSSLLIAIFSPFMLAIAWCVRRDGGAAIYASPRLGCGGKLFFALKFRTMIPDAETKLSSMLEQDPVLRREWKTNFKLQRDPRITPVGRLLRRLSLDELPQLFNVIRGDMSLVGPRPILPAERIAYGEAFYLYSESAPGLTGPWQVSGRTKISYERRIQLNTWYIRHASIWTDIAILLRTVPAVIRGTGAL